MADNPPSERVFISQLPAGLDEGRFKELFGAYGSIQWVKLMQGNCALVAFGTVDEAKWVVQNLDGNMPEGIPSPINAKFGNPPKGGGGGGGGGSWNNGPQGGGGGWGGDRSSPYGGKGGGNQAFGKGGSIQMLKNSLINQGCLPGGKNSKERSDAQQVYVRGLPGDTTDQDLSDMFGPFGAIPARGVKAMLSPDGQCTGIGFVDFVEPACAAKACQALNGAMLPDGTSLRVNVKNSTKGKGKGKGE